MAVVIPIISTFDSKGIKKAVADFKHLEGAGQKTAFGLLNANKAMSHLGKTVMKFGAIAAGVTGIISSKLISAGSNLAESISKVQVVFGESASAVEAFAATSAESMGIAKQQALEATGTFGNLLQAFGTGQVEAMKMSVSMVQLAGDLASFNNVPVADALLAIRSGLSGEAEPLKRFGIAINDARMKEEALRMGLYKGKGILSIVAKSQAAYALIMKDSSLAQGDYARTAAGVANSQRTMQAKMADVSAELGLALQPAMQMVLKFMDADFIPLIEKFTHVVGIQGLGGGFKFLTNEMLDFIQNLEGKSLIIYGMVATFIAIKAAVAAYNTVMKMAVALNIAFEASNPFALAAAAIAIVVVAIAALYLKFEGVRTVVNIVVNAVIQHFETMANVIITIINGIIKGINLLISGANLFGAGIKKIDPIVRISLGRMGDAAADASFKFAALHASFLKARDMEGFTPAPAGLNVTGFDFNRANDENQKRLQLDRFYALLRKKEREKNDKGEDPLEKARRILSAYTSALQGYGNAQKAVTGAVKSLADAQLAQGNALDDLRVAQDKFNKVSKGYGVGSKEAKDATRNLAQAQRDATRASIAQRKAVQDVTNAQQALDDLKSGKATNRATEDLASATAQVADAQKKLDAAYIQGGQETINDAVTRLNIAYDEQKEATEAVRDAQDKSTPAAMAEAEDALTTAKLNLVDQTLAQDDANQLVIDSQTLLNEAISGATATTDVYKEAQKELADALMAVADANDAITQSILDRKDVERELRNAKADLTVATKGTTDAQRKSAGKLTGIKAMASGGIVNKPTLAMIGEAGAEAVMPLDRVDNGSTYNITVNAGIGDPVAIGREVVSVLQAYQRRSGAIPIKVA